MTFFSQKMEKLPMCRICLTRNTRMYVVVNKDLRDLYEKLTDIPFVTKDSRPILACFFCCAKLKQCFWLRKKCLEADEQFAQMMNEPNPPINPDRFKVYGGFIRCPIVHISIVDNSQTESIAMEEEFPADCHELEDITEPQEDSLSNDLEPDVENSYLDVKDMLRDHPEPDSEGDVPLMEVNIKVEEVIEVPEKKQTAAVTNNLPTQENIDNSCLSLPPHHSELEVDVPLREETAEEETLEVPVKKRRAVETNSARVTRRTKLEEPGTAELKRNEPSNLKDSRTTPGTSSDESDECDQRSLYEVKKRKRHTQTRISKKRYECDVCQRSFSQIGNLKRHIRIVHTGEKPYQCDVCQLSFGEKRNLTSHIRIHTGEKPYKCDVCQRSFSEKGSLIQHIRIHTGVKPYKCDVCQRSFSNLGYLNRHIRIVHTGEKPYQCDVCQHSFGEKGNLTKHFRTHTGEKPFKCDVCQRGFSERGSLTRHFRTHTGEKPYKCDVCPRSFSKKKYLTKHNIRIHTGESSASPSTA